MRLLLICLVLITAWFAFPAHAQKTDDLNALTEAEAEARAREAALQADRIEVSEEINSLKTVLQRDSDQTHAFERRRTELLAELAETERRIALAKAELTENRSQIQTLLASLQRLQIAPSVAILVDPDDAVRTAQAATMIHLLSQQLRARAEAVATLAETLQQRRDVARIQQEDINANARELESRLKRTETLVAEKEKLRQSIETEAEAARSEAIRLAAESATLRDLLERVSRAAEAISPRLKPDIDGNREPGKISFGGQRFAEAKGGVIKPVSGRLALAYGGAERGDTYSAPSGGQVLAPYAGRVDFSGPFKTYGRVVILNLNDGYYLLLTGLGQTYVAANETVRRGEPIGQMPRTGNRALLYMELRRNGQPINPAPWMGGRS